ncbi:teichoic acids export ABC transporter ATP-binding subunit TagH [Bacillus alkalisoli]|uniref:teichoic acids export ABC transporter ATP-binding subunit TagH n=1 Tax=Bacillus alkalisoli TaxID=2011008 RepID=UPI000C24E343|nr:teichoic acids export ABC transporter ATP-binding subunit TagH [Bacillus alkalisoli]
MSSSVIFKNATKKYKLYDNKVQKLLDILVPDGCGDDFYAINNISFTANKGEVIGVVGVNGAGKSTLSNLITGVIPPSSGIVKVNGKASLIAISSGLNNKLSGRENIELKCLMLGFSKKEIQDMMDDIIEFADIGRFIDQPVKNYSSGMKSRLGFAISVNIDPDVLVVDEALSVGDQTFADKCLIKMNEFKEKGKTIFFISHSMTQIKMFCNKVLWLEAGEIRDYGGIDEVLPNYIKFLKDFKAMTKEEQKSYKEAVLRNREMMNNAVGDLEQLEEVKDKNNRRERKGRLNKSKLYFSIISISIILIIASYILYGLMDKYGIIKENNITEYENILEDNLVYNSIPIEREGAISVLESDLYFDEELKYKIRTLNFTDHVYVTEELNGKYKISIENISGFIRKEEVNFINQYVRTDNLSIIDFLPLFPLNFTNSYEYFLINIGISYEDLINKFPGIVSERINDNGNKLVTLINENITYTINDKNIVNGLIVEDIENENDVTNGLRNDAYIVSREGDLLYFKVNSYDILLNFDSKVIQILDVSD